MNTPRMLRRSLVALAVAVSLAACGSSDDADAPVAATEVLEWNSFASDIVQDQFPPVRTHVLAMVQIAVHDALNTIEPRYERYAHAGSATAASPDAAVAAAVRDTLIRLLPAAAPSIDAQYDARLAALPGGAARDAGVAVGQAAAASILARRSGDDLAAAFGKPYTPGQPAPGVYQPTAPFVFGAGLGEVVPFALSSSGQFRSPAPLAPTTGEYAQDYDEVKQFGSAASTARTAEQTETARFWYDAATKEWHTAARKGLADVSADAWQAARTLALVGIAMTDVVVASFDNKFSDDYWRPITAIRAGDADGNDATSGDASWEPLCVTPPFPEHNSTHAATGAAAAEVLALTIGDDHTFTVDSVTLPGSSRSYGRFSDAAAEEGVSRVYCGIHFRNAMNAGLAQGKSVAGHVVGNLLRPTGGQR